ncbi:LANO_0E07624g1_1 [Lachancea nothofagi CBS 11611]|uniref:Ureidoglycolate lyase n=1 Tax=Lachancea nothofagi CBS 11611 TaxID=1266666 RepID=A0A1G4JV08_9SACH|nr:LANO_0E07624g1_1 [Lachancea nothofagi CBS 11611]
MIHIVAEPIGIAKFRNYGSIISPDEEVSRLTEKTKGANQGTAIKIVKVSRSQNLFPEHCGVKAPHWNMFRSFPQPHLKRNIYESSTGEIIEHSIKVLEKHPFSSQTFVPMGRCADNLAYLVVVALPDNQGGPDLSTLKAFTCKGSQAVTYGAGVWHAPMIVIGDLAYLDFSVLIHELGDEDRPEMDLVETHYREGEVVVNMIAQA